MPDRLKRPAYATLGVVVLAIPTIYTVFAHEIGGSALWLRIVLVVAWVIAAAILGRAAARREHRVEQAANFTLQQQGELEDELLLAVRDSIRAILDQQSSATKRFRLFVPDGRVLVPFYEPAPEPWQRWTRGQGVVGTVWEHRKALELSEKDLGDSLLGLTQAQSEHYRDLRVISAVPVGDPTAKPGAPLLGVLAMSSTTDTAFDDAAHTHQVALSSTMAQLLRLL